MKIRRVVTGLDAAGQSVFISDAPVPRACSFQSVPGHAMAHVWSTGTTPTASDAHRDPTAAHPSLVPGPGETSLAIYDFPPDSVMHNPTDVGLMVAELGGALPGLFERFEPEQPGMHTTPTIDYGILLEGELWLELDNGEQKRIQPGDVVIQHGNRHAWRNKSDRIARALFVMIGAHHR
ncbi:cupin [Pseudomonas chlororaphis]|uniref:Cupin n=1 Tax=Pseudomonas chlororaphis TaxID=587753 RepID=A0A0G3GH97_9PSED|nr:cupin [Pseudomonas chlororaphis]